MAEIRTEGRDLVLDLTFPEKVAALHGDVRVPLSAVRDVEVVDEPLAAVREMRAPGLHLPWRTKIGTWRGRGRRTFVVARSGRPAVRVALEGQRFTELLACVPDARAAAAAVRSGARR